MFTGIVEATGRIVRTEPRGGDVRLVVDAGTLGLDDVAIGDSIAVSGVCLTAVALEGNAFVVDVSNETLSRTSLGALGNGARV
ncbi:MAG TPA: riboflavin synthase, partial [Rhodanobacteraceae bacterium]|nr:riboflavin synthase [Rhodanobacteraceae bacterium]